MTKVENWLLKAKLWHILVVVVLFAVTLTAAITIPVEAENANRAELCAGIGAEPVKIRAWVQFCELPSGDIIGLPNKTDD